MAYKLIDAAHTGAKSTHPSSPEIPLPSLDNPSSSVQTTYKRHCLRPIKRFEKTRRNFVNGRDLTLRLNPAEIETCIIAALLPVRTSDGAKGFEP
jgi:hypothetical protein